MTQCFRESGIIFVISGPSGAGKSTICNAVMAADNNLKFSVSCTTRSARPDEKDGEDYYFITRDLFNQRIENNDFLEYATVYGELYGTLRIEIEKNINISRDTLLDIDFQGAGQIKKLESNKHLFHTFRYIFIAPPTVDELRHRLKTRATETDSVILRRLETADNELEQCKNYDYLVINSQIEDAVNQVLAIIQSERLRVQC